jgi:hypothetical protein
VKHAHLSLIRTEGKRDSSIRLQIFDCPCASDSKSKDCEQLIFDLGPVSGDLANQLFEFCNLLVGPKKSPTPVEANAPIASSSLTVFIVMAATAFIGLLILLANHRRVLIVRAGEA